MQVVRDRERVRAGDTEGDGVRVPVADRERVTCAVRDQDPVAEGEGVAVAEAGLQVRLPVRVALGVGVGLAEAVWDGLRGGERVGVAVPVAVRVDWDRDEEAVAEGLGLGERDLGVGVALRLPEAVAEPVHRPVPVRDTEGLAEAVCVALPVTDGVEVRLRVGVCVGSAVVVRVRVRVGEALRCGEAEGDAEAVERDGVAVGPLPVGVRELPVGLGVREAVRVRERRDAVGLGEKERLAVVPVSEARDAVSRGDPVAEALGVGVADGVAVSVSEVEALVEWVGLGVAAEGVVVGAAVGVRLRVAEGEGARLRDPLSLGLRLAVRVRVGGRLRDALRVRVEWVAERRERLPERLEVAVALQVRVARAVLLRVGDVLRLGVEGVTVVLGVALGVGEGVRRRLRLVERVGLGPLGVFVEVQVVVVEAEMEALESVGVGVGAEGVADGEAVTVERERVEVLVSVGEGDRDRVWEAERVQEPLEGERVGEPRVGEAEGLSDPVRLQVLVGRRVALFVEEAEGAVWVSEDWEPVRVRVRVREGRVLEEVGELLWDWDGDREGVGDAVAEGLRVGVGVRGRVRLPLRVVVVVGRGVGLPVGETVEDLVVGDTLEVPELLPETVSESEGAVWLLEEDREGVERESDGVRDLLREAVPGALGLDVRVPEGEALVLGEAVEPLHDSEAERVAVGVQDSGDGLCEGDPERLEVAVAVPVRVGIWEREGEGLRLQDGLREGTNDGGDAVQL